jgi:hypothetical protein
MTLYRLNRICAEAEAKGEICYLCYGNCCSVCHPEPIRNASDLIAQAIEEAEVAWAVRGKWGSDRRTAVRDAVVAALEGNE